MTAYNSLPDWWIQARQEITKKNLKEYYQDLYWQRMQDRASDNLIDDYNPDYKGGFDLTEQIYFGGYCIDAQV